MNNKETLINQLSALGLSAEESRIYLELLQEQRTHLELARKTGINRTKVYRIAEDLEKRSLIARQTDDRGTFLIATDPTTLEVQIASKEEKLKNQRDIFANLLPQLNELQKNSSYAPGFFEVNTYEGVDGMKQMLWHELKAKDEVLLFGSGTLDKVVNDDKRFAERHRAMTVAAGYHVREIINPNEKDECFTSLEEFKAIFSKKEIPRSKLRLDQQIVIYNDTVAVYHWRNNEKVGYEVINEAYATMWRQLFEHYWDELD
jgi:sugar-specific transcriptional regulator TrmB